MKKRKKKIDIGQGEIAPKKMYVLFDKANGDSGSRRYIWFFSSIKKARAHKKWQNSNWNNAKLAGPVVYTMSRKQK